MEDKVLNMLEEPVEQTEEESIEETNIASMIEEPVADVKREGRYVKAVKNATKKVRGRILIAVGLIAFLIIGAAFMVFKSYKSPKETLILYIEHLTNSEFRKAAEMSGLWDGDISALPNSNSFENYLYDDIKYTIKSVDIVGLGKCEMLIDIEQVDMREVFSDMINVHLPNMIDSDEDIINKNWDTVVNDYIKSKIFKEDTVRSTFRAAVKMEYKKGKWILSEDNIQFTDALSGGLVAVQNELQEVILSM